MMGIENSNWIVDVHTVLERDEANDASSQLRIWKIPSEMKTNTKQYIPLRWQFGLHHCPQSLHSNETKGFKVEIARALQLTGERWDNFCKHVVFEDKAYWEVVYHQSPHAHSYTIEEIRCRLALDALFLVVLLQRRSTGMNSLGPKLKKVMQNPVCEIYYCQVGDDFFLEENQIPMKLLERVVGILTVECKDNVGDMQKWENKDWHIRIILASVEWDHFHDPQIDAIQKQEVFITRMNKWLQDVDSYHGVHILDSIYSILCGRESLEVVHAKPFPRIYSATDLAACGVTIKGKEFTCFEDISFKKGCLLVPFLQVFDDTEAYLRNLVVHEHLTRPNGQRQYAARCFTYFMGGLMRTPEDVILLEKWDVLSIHVGSHDIVVDMWKRINYYISVPDVTNDFSKMMIEVSNYTKRRRNKYQFEFKKQFCSRPWIPLSCTAATLVTIATLMQTYVAIIGSNRMKPHFLPQN